MFAIFSAIRLRAGFSIPDRLGNGSPDRGNVGVFPGDFFEDPFGGGLYGPGGAAFPRGNLAPGEPMLNDKIVSRIAEQNRCAENSLML